MIEVICTTAVRAEVRSLPVSDPKAKVPRIIFTYENECTPRGCEKVFTEMCVFDGSHVVERVSPASVAEAAARAASLNCTRCFVVFLC